MTPKHKNMSRKGEKKRLKRIRRRKKRRLATSLARALGIADREGYPIPLRRFFIICFGVTMVNLLVSTLYLYIM